MGRDAHEKLHGIGNVIVICKKNTHAHVNIVFSGGNTVYIVKLASCGPPLDRLWLQLK